MTPRQEVMFDAVIDQHRQNIPSDIFPFSWYKAQQFFDEHGYSVKFGIDPLSDHIELLEELAALGAIKMRMVEIDKYSMIPIDPDDPEWREYIIPMNGNYYICDICINNKSAHKVKYSFSKKYKAQLFFDNDDCSYFHVRVKNDGDYYYRELRKDGYPYKIFEYAVAQWKNGREDPILRSELVDADKMRDNQPSVKNLFKDQPVIREALSPFIDIQPNSAMFKDDKVSISESERVQIQKYSNKQRFIRGLLKDLVRT